MKDIEGIEDVLAHLEPHWPEVEAEFNAQNERYLTLAAADHETIGRVLRAHLVIENFIDTFLAEQFKIADPETLRLSFFQKASLLPSAGNPAAFVKPGILQLNRIRNKFGHRLDFAFASHEISAIYEALHVARRGTRFASDVDAIEAFAPVACAFLAVPPKKLRQAFAEAFDRLRSFTPENIGIDDRGI